MLAMVWRAKRLVPKTEASTPIRQRDQSHAQQDRDKDEVNNWAVSQSRFDPNKLTTGSSTQLQESSSKSTISKVRRDSWINWRCTFQSEIPALAM